MRILHLSDLHFGIGTDGAKGDRRANCLRCLLDTVSEINSENKIDYIVISGDIAFSGSEKEYQEADKFIERLVEKSKIEPSNIIICPGNHDFNRGTGAALSIPSTMKECVATYNVDTLQTICTPFQGYINFCKRNRIATPRYAVNHECYLFGVCAYPNINFLVLNSAWCKEEGKSWVGKSFLDSIINGGVLNNENITVAVMHHPSSELMDFELTQYGTEAPSYDTIEELSNIVLCGHTHGTSISVKNAGKGNGKRIACGASYESKDYRNSIVVYDIQSGNIVITPFYYEGDKWVKSKEESHTFEKRATNSNSTLTGKKSSIYSELLNLSFQLEQCTQGRLEKGGILIWPIVPRREITIIHQAEIELISLICKKYPWEVKVLISNCGTKAQGLNPRQIQNFESSVLLLMKKRGIIAPRVEMLSHYYATTPNNSNADRSSQILSNFIAISNELRQKELAELKNKEYSDEMKKQIFDLPVIDYLLPVLQLSVVLYISKVENEGKNSLLIAGSDEREQWRKLCHRDSSFGTLLIPTLKESEKQGCSQQSIKKYLSQRDVLENLTHGNFGYWFYTMFVHLQVLADHEHYKPLISAEELNKWNCNQFEIPPCVNPNELAKRSWDIVSLAISD